MLSIKFKLWINQRRSYSEGQYIGERKVTKFGWGRGSYPRVYSPNHTDFSDLLLSVCLILCISHYE